jgi:hypothetical protein
LIHMLALPAQLRNNFCLSFLEKNRSRTEDGKVSFPNHRRKVKA